MSRPFLPEILIFTSTTLPSVLGICYLSDHRVIYNKPQFPLVKPNDRMITCNKGSSDNYSAVALMSRFRHPIRSFQHNTYCLRVLEQLSMRRGETNYKQNRKIFRLSYLTSLNHHHPSSIIFSLHIFPKRYVQGFHLFFMFS